MVIVSLGEPRKRGIEVLSVEHEALSMSGGGGSSSVSPQQGST